MKKFAKGGKIGKEGSKEEERTESKKEARKEGDFRRGGKAKKFARGGSIDGVAQRGHTKAKGANIGPVVGKKKGGRC